MRRLNTNTKIAAIRLFLSGSTYDEIAQQLGIGKGSVVSIIDGFREGRLQVPLGMTEYIDLLRRLVVDMRKHQTTVGQLVLYLRIHKKLKEIGVGSDKVEEWLDVCRDVAESASSGGKFVGAVLELVRESSETGLTYEELVVEYQSKMATLKRLEEEIEKMKRQLTDMKARHRQEMEQARKALDAVTEAAQTAQEAFRRQKDEIRSNLEEYAAQKGLTMKKIELIIALFNHELGKAMQAI